MKKFNLIHHRLILTSLALVVLTYLKLSSQTCTPFAIPYPRMGTNVPDVWNLPWINLWHQINGSHSSFGPDRLELAPDGWTTTKSNHNIRIGMDQPLLIPIVGHVKISYKGNLSQLDNFNYPVVTSQANFPQPGYSYYVLNVNIPVASVSGPTISMQFHGRVEDVKIMRPGFELDETQIIHPLYTSVLKNFTTLRWMPFLNTNAWYVNNQYDCAPTGTVNWSIRSNPNMPQSMTGTKGGAWEYVVRISNEFNKDLWINIPVRATDDYVTNLAQFLKDNLKPGLNVYMEIGNETWNTGGGFCSFKQLHQIYEGDMNAHRRFHGVRGKEIVDIFASVWGWGEINNRIRMLIPGQIAYGVEGDGWAVKASLKWMDDNHGALNVKKYFYGAAATAYIGCHNFSSLPNMFNSMRNSIDVELFGEFSTEAAFGGGYYGNKYEGWLGTAGEYGLKLLVYEGNPEFGSSGGGGLKAAAYDDPEMESTMLYAYNRWFSRYGYNALFNQFQGQFAPHGLYCLGTDLNRKSKLQSAIDIMTSNPAPPFDPQFRHIIPGTFLGKKFASYPSTWNNEPSYLMKAPWSGEPHLEGRQRWIFASERNGNYSLDILHSNGKNAFYDIYLDGDLIYSNVMLPNTGGAQVYSSAQGVTLNFNVSYGVHVLKLQAKNETVDWIRLFKFDLINESPPFRPSIVSGDLYACNGQPDAKYEVDVDGSVCEYKWVGLPPTATINPDAGGPATGLPRSGARTNLIYVNWGSTPNGTYNLTVFGINAVGTSPGRAFNVLVTTCGFTMAPNPTCTNTGVTITPATPGAVNYKWDFGINSTPRTYTTTLAGTLPFNVVYTVSGSKTVSLTVTFSGGSTKTYLQNILVSSSPTIGSITPALQSACSGGSVSLSVSGTGSSYQWYYSTNGGVTYTAYPGATLPRFTFTGLSGTTLFKASVTNLGCPSLTTSGAATANISTSVVSFSYGSSSYCSGVATPVGTFGGGSFSHLSGPGSILLNTLTGSITIAGSSVGVHTIRYFAPAAGACPSVAGQNTITITGGVSLAISGPTTFCGGTSITLTASGATTYNWQPGNLSGAIQTLSPVGTTTYTISGTFAGCNAVTTHLLSMAPASTPGVNISALQNNVCSGSGMTFVATPVNGGTPAYQWKRNGIDIGTNSATLTGSTFSHGDVIRVVMTGVGACINNTPVTSTGITLTVNPNVTPSINATASQNGICSGTTVTFTGVPTNGGSAPSYQWQVNGVNAGTNSPVYVYTPDNNDQVRVRLTSNASCASPTTATSSIITMSVSGTVTPTAAISASQSNICSGTGVTFSSTISGGGASPTYQWQVNGVNVGANSPTYSSSTFSHGQIVRLILTSSSACASPTTATSNMVTLTVNSNVTPSINATASQNGICSGTTVTFTGVPTNGGSAPSYQWQVNGVNAGTNSPTYVYTPAHNDQVRVQLTGNAQCSSPTTATSNVIILTVNPNVTPSINATASQNGICSGTTVTFTGVPTNGGSAPSYQWQVNGVNAGTNSPVYVYTPANNDQVRVRLTSNASCASPTTATSSIITMSVSGTVTPTAAISASQSNICSGTGVTFSSTISGGGASPTYQWQVNGVNVGTNSPTYSSSTFSHGQIVRLILTSSSACASPATVTSSGVTMNVSAPLAATPVSIGGCTLGQAQASFSLTSGATGTVSVSGTSISGVVLLDSPYHYVSNLLNDGTQPRYVIQSGGACAPITVSGSTINCACPSPGYTAVVKTPNAVCSGTNSTVITLSGVTGTPNSYRWQRSTDGGTSWSDVGVSIFMLTLNNSSHSENGHQYRLIMSNACGSSVTSAGVSLIVHPQVGPSTLSGISESCGSASDTYMAGAPYADSYAWGVIPGSAGVLSGGVITWNGAFSGTATITVSGQSAHGCGSGAPSSMSVSRRVPLSFSNLQVSTCNASLEATVRFDINGGRGVYTVSGASSGVTSGLFTSGLLPNGHHTFVVSDGGACTPLTISSHISCSCPAPVIGTGPVSPASMCEGSGTVLVMSVGNVSDSYAPISYRWYENGTEIIWGSQYSIASNGSSGGGSTLSISGATSFQNNYSYRVVATNSCGSSTSSTGVTISVIARDDASFSYPSASYCSLDHSTISPNIMGLPGGTFSYTTAGSGTLSINAADGTFTPSSSGGSQSYTVRYTTNGTCPSSSSYTISVVTNPGNASISYPGPYCSSGSIATPQLGPNAGIGTIRVLSGSGLAFVDISQGIVNVSASTIGTYVLENVFSVSGCGTDTKTTTITIHGQPMLSNFSYGGPYCSTQSGVLLPFPTQSTGGYYHISSGTINTLTGEVSLGTAGNYTIRYTIPASNGCYEVSSTTGLVITPLPSAATFSYGSVCSNAGEVLPTGSYGGGLFSSLTASVNATTGSVNLGSGTEGTHTITYTKMAQGGCGEVVSTAILTVNGVPAMQMSGNYSICSGGSTELTASGANSYFWEPGNQSGNRYIFTQTAVQVFGISVTGTSLQGCTSKIIQPITVLGLPTVNILGVSGVCSLLGTTLTATGAASYKWADGSTNSIYHLSNMTTTVIGLVTGTGVNGCYNSAQKTIGIYTLPNVSPTSSRAEICIGESVNIQSNATGTGALAYAWSNGEQTNSITPIPASAGVNTYAVNVRDQNQCTVSGMVSVTVNSLPVLTPSADVTICSGGSAILTVGGANTYSWQPGNGAGNALIVSPSAIGTTAYTVSGTDTKGCVSRASVAVTVRALPLIKSLEGIRRVCAGNMLAITVSGGTSYTLHPLNQRFASNGEISSYNRELASGAYSFTGVDAHGCEGKSGVFSVEIEDSIATPTLSYGGNLHCGEGRIEAQLTNGRSTGYYLHSGGSGLDINTTSGTLNLSNSKEGIYSIYYAIPGTAVCAGKESAQYVVSITGSKGGVASWNGVGSAVCDSSQVGALVSGYRGVLSWERYHQATGEWEALQGESGEQLQTKALAAQGEVLRLRAKANHYQCAASYSNVLTVNVSPKAVAGVISHEQKVVCGDYVVRTEVAGYSGVLSWEWGTDTTSMQPIGAEGYVYKTGAIETRPFDDYDQSRYYRAVLQSGACPVVKTKALEARSCKEGNKIPNVFAPNTAQSSNNSHWRLDSLNLKDEAEIFIFDRYGNQVYYTTGKEQRANPWDGSGLPAATYYYMIDNKPKNRDRRPLSGHVTLVK